MSVKDIKIPADASDQQTTDAKSAIPPVEFTVARSGGVNVISISDRQGVQNRLPTQSYRVYFLPAEYAPIGEGTTSTIPAPVVYNTVVRKAGRKVADLVTDISAPGLGTVLNYSDSINAGRDGYYFCCAVNRAGVEAPPEHMISTEGIQTATAATATGSGSGGGGGGAPPILIYVADIDGLSGSLHLVAGTNMTITPSGGDTFTFDATGGGASFTKEDSSTTVDGIATVFTFSTAVAVNDVIVADGLVMDETFGDYTRGGVTVTFALAPISTVQRIF